MQATLGSANASASARRARLTISRHGRTVGKDAGAASPPGKAVVGAIEDRRPATTEDMRDLHAELRRVSRRLDAIEKRLPAKRAAATKKRKST